QESACTNAYPGASAIHTVSTNVALKEWTTLQRNASHTGFVNARLDASRFTKAWEWTTPDASSFTNYAIPVNGSAYLSTNTRIYSLNEATGTQNWSHTPPSPL